MHKIELNQQFKTALDLIEKTSESVFVTGKAGTGKSTLLTYLQDVTKKSMVVLAPTGVAALNVRGETIHSFFRFKPNVTIEEAKKAARKVKDNDLYKNIDLIVIDEISMVRADLLDCVDVFLRAVLRKREPFGGIQMVFIGDMYNNKEFHFLSSDVAQMLQRLGLTMKANLVWYDVSKKLHIYGYQYEYIPSMVHQNILIFRKEVRQKYVREG